MKFSQYSEKILEKEDDLIQAKMAEENPWGISMSLDLYHCDLDLMKDEQKIKQFVKELVKLIDMKAFQDTKVVHFGDDPRVAGFSIYQLIETSAISGHFANNTKAIYFDIFTCKTFRPHQAAGFCKKFFKAKEMHIQIAFRY